ncbi:predicted protein [Phaeodactylum tricornutum CCAP 1055/1]|uniref:FPL domain-containing protein n=1 Tax=Phaeodactylum tricornutum (strain CCAP 1055/1) TaxID=556484 RepID=B7GAQ5_PHATC|nr:predicted protein [Phaeodactylum tricornutum CCAP 1055/1]EEC44415.1 predicted protein [Phaeodactylum tricornutum CCAP 1055/1]|eukprot:XP_002184237.1 predicted protein [Phaeodactylum tricornutum CCAP 1055/1]
MKRYMFGKYRLRVPRFMEDERVHRYSVAYFVCGSLRSRHCYSSGRSEKGEYWFVGKQEARVFTTSSPERCLHGVVWSPLVKTQVLHTVTLLVSGVRDPSALYFILSQNCINALIACILPPALETTPPLYVGLINLGISPPQLFPFLAVHEPTNDHVHFPLSSVTLDTATSACAYAQSNAYVYFTCLNLIVDFLQNQYAPIREWIRGAEREQCLLASHLAALLRRMYQRIANLASGPVVDDVRSNAVVSQLTVNGLHEEIDALNDVFFCGIQGLNVRLCEDFLQTVVFVLFCLDCYHHKKAKSLMVGIVDANVIPEKEAQAQVTVSFSCEVVLTVRGNVLID